jgi:fructokinase
VKMLGGIEAGGTKFVCGVGTGPDDLKTVSFPTTTPEETIGQVVSFFRNAGNLEAVGIGSFGPVDLHPQSPFYGFITSTPKPGWANFGLAGAIRNALGVPVGFDTDGNAALLGEARWGAARGLTDAVYMTIGTGVGGGALANGRIIHGLVHPEMGHLRLPHDLTRDPYRGFCTYHGDCLEGLTCGPSIQDRWGVPGPDLPDAHPAWALEAHYLGLGLANLMVTLSPQRFVLGGGVMRRASLFPLVRREFAEVLNNYVRHTSVIDKLDELIVPPQLSGCAGVLGAFVLAEEALASSLPSSPALRGPRA